MNATSLISMLLGYGGLAADLSLGQAQTQAVTTASFGMIVAAILAYTVARTLVVQGGALVLIRSAPALHKRRIYRLPWSKSQVWKELDAAIGVLLLDALFLGIMIQYQLFSSAEPGWLSHCLGFALPFVWFEIWFYASHRAFHTRAFSFLHEQHHIAKVTSPMTALSFSALERLIILLGGLLPMALISRWIPMSATGIVTYLLSNYLLNVYGHLNVEWVPSHWLRFKGLRFLNTTTYHALHHARYKGHFGLFTPFLDRIFGTEFPDYLPVQKAAFEGKGLTSLSERLSAS